MNVNEVIKKIKVMMGAQDIRLAEATLVDGTEVYTEGELQEGAILFVRAGDGVSEDPFAPTGMHELSDGKIVTVGENGEITKIEDAAAATEYWSAINNQVAAQPAAPKVSNTFAEVLADKRSKEDAKLNHLRALRNN